MSMLEPTGKAAVVDAIRSHQQLSSSDIRNEVNLDTQAGNRIPTRRVESVATNYVDALKAAIGLIQPDLLQVESVLNEQMAAGASARDRTACANTACVSGTIQSMLDYVKELGGKRLRPSLTLLAAKACGKVTEETVRLAASIELVHTATLVHDDIIDNADERRHRPTAHKLWGAHQSVLIGDWLFTHAYELANLGQSTVPGRWISRAAKRVCEGEIRQGQSVGRVDLKEDEYFDILDAKTGALCEVSCRLGAWSAGADEATIEAFAAFGSKLGIAFQVYDDWLDVWGDPESAGKTLGTDLLSLKPTLPTIVAIERDADRTFATRWTDGRFRSQAELRVELDQLQASEYTQDKANQIGAEAIRCLEDIAQVKQLDSPSVEALAHLAFCATHRSA